MCMCGTGSNILLGFVNAREVGVSSRNLVSRTFPQIFQSMLTPMQRQNTKAKLGVRCSYRPALPMSLLLKIELTKLPDPEN